MSVHLLPPQVHLAFGYRDVALLPRQARSE